MEYFLEQNSSQNISKNLLKTFHFKIKFKDRMNAMLYHKPFP